MQPVQGIHHITAIASDPQANIDFYQNLLGQRLVKRTVNFDDPGTYHFYYADEIGTPGTIMTFFPWRHMARGKRGNGEVIATAYIIRPASLEYWRERLSDHGIAVEDSSARFGQQVVAFDDPDGTLIELVATDEAANVRVWENGPIPAEHAIRGFYGATLAVARAEPTGRLLTEQLGFSFIGQEGNRSRYMGASGDVGVYVDLLENPGLPGALMGAGSVHHIAFRTVDDSEQLEYQRRLREAGFQVTQVMDRQYFHSIYFRSPSGVLFEIATDAPGFYYDEPIPELGSSLKLPPWLESHRASISASLPEIRVKPVTSEA